MTTWQSVYDSPLLVASKKTWDATNVTKSPGPLKSQTLCSGLPKIEDVWLNSLTFKGLWSNGNEERGRRKAERTLTQTLRSVFVQQDSLHSRDTRKLAKLTNKPSPTQATALVGCKQANHYFSVGQLFREQWCPGTSKEAGAPWARQAQRPREPQNIYGCLAAHLLRWAFWWLSKHGLKTSLGDPKLDRACFECLSCTSPMKITWNKIPSRRRKYDAFALVPLSCSIS